MLARHGKRAGVALMVVGIMIGFVLSVSGWLILRDWKLLFVILAVLSPTLILSGAFLSWRGRQYAAQAIAESIITDSKPDLLYLRPFRSDYTTTKVVFRTRPDWTTEEEQLADVLRPFGDLVAIGRPGESLPTPGAARIYTSDEEWKTVVKHQMQATRLVVIRAAVGENVLWELTQAVRTVDPPKVLILALNMTAEDYESFRIKANPILGKLLPERTALWRFGRVSGFISFGSDWEPSFLALKAPYLRSGSFKSLAKYALRPVFESFDLEWQRPPISAYRLSMVVIGVVFAGAIVLATSWVLLVLVASGS
jgi:hypothetical protein